MFGTAEEWSIRSEFFVTSFHPYTIHIFLWLWSRGKAWKMRSVRFSERFLHSAAAQHLWQVLFLSLSSAIFFEIGAFPRTLGPRFHATSGNSLNRCILRVEQKAIVGNVNLASNRDYNHGVIIRICMGINKVLLLLNEHGDPSFLFQNLSYYNINNQ